MAYNQIKNIIKNRFEKTNNIKLNSHHIRKNNMILKNDSDYFYIDYSNNFSNYDY